MSDSTSSLPSLALIATGGTIAGRGSQDRYVAGSLEAEALFEAVPALRELARWRIEQPFSLDSRDLTPAHWLMLAARAQALLEDPAISGLVIPHGTDTLEETAFALHLLLPVGKPIVLTAAMRPADSLSADGPLNLLQAAQVALAGESRNRGVLVVSNESIHAAREISKIRTHAPDALASPTTGSLGSVCGSAIRYACPAGEARPAWLPLVSPEAMPRVEILPAYAGVDAYLFDAALSAGASGLVLALPGHGSLPEALRPSVRRAISAGVMIVRASRIGPGVWHNHNEDDDGLGLIAAERLNAWQARVLLILALASGLEKTGIASLFARL